MKEPRCTSVFSTDLCAPKSSTSHAWVYNLIFHSSHALNLSLEEAFPHLPALNLRIFFPTVILTGDAMFQAVQCMTSPPSLIPFRCQAHKSQSLDAAVSQAQHSIHNTLVIMNVCLVSQVTNAIQLSHCLKWLVDHKTVSHPRRRL